MDIYGVHVSDSSAAAHPTMWSLDMFLEEHDETGSFVVHPEVSPDRSMPDPYYRGAYALASSCFTRLNTKDEKEAADRINQIIASMHEA